MTLEAFEAVSRCRYQHETTREPSSLTLPERRGRYAPRVTGAKSRRN